ncbi:hypothetical protein [Photobacterium leiognathi]|uniref:hypothetical protein n=1 Tax=Photobacterium leiognathi TaxID=553611 RepID=UPI0029813C80|nr:hypothetical protein [Photobacterium leiognathi]
MHSRSIRLFHRRINFNSKPEQRTKCERSLAHSLRIAPPTSDATAKKIEWNESLSCNNLIWLNGKTVRLNQFSEEARLQLLKNVAPKHKVPNQAKQQAKLRSYRSKVKKAIVSEMAKGNKEAAELLQYVIECKNVLPEDLIVQFEALNMQRKQQRVKMLATYVKYHNQLCNIVPANNVYVQEGIIKVPHQWEVGTDVISLQEYIDFTQQFLSKHFPSHQILMLIGHDDERSVHQNTGAHVHYFLSGRNNETGDYDLRKQQVAVVNQYIKKNRIPNVTLFPDSGNLSRKQCEDFGRIFQRMLYDFANQSWLSPKDLVAEFAPETEKNSKQRKWMNEEAKQPKSQRSYNYYTHQLMLIKQESEKEQRRCNELRDEKQRYSQEVNKLLVEKSELMMKKEELEQETITIEKENAELEAKRDSLLASMSELHEKAIRMIERVFKSLLLSLYASDKGMPRKSSEYLNQAFKQSEPLPSVFKLAMTRLIGEIKAKFIKQRINGKHQTGNDS